MITIKSDRVVYCDVDDTLIMWPELGQEGYKPHLKHIEMLKRFKSRGQAVIVWSAGGHEWAEHIVKELGLEPYVDAVLCKPSWYMDDLMAQEFLPEVNRIYVKQE